MPLCCQRNDHPDLPPNQVGRQDRQPVDLIVGPAVFNRAVLTLDKAGLPEALAKGRREGHVAGRAAQKADHRHRRLLRTRGERPRCRAAEERDERASSHGPRLPQS